MASLVDNLKHKSNEFLGISPAIEQPKIEAPAQRFIDAFKKVLTQKEKIQNNNNNNNAKTAGFVSQISQKSKHSSSSIPGDGTPTVRFYNFIFLLATFSVKYIALHL